MYLSKFAFEKRGIDVFEIKLFPLWSSESKQHLGEVQSIILGHGAVLINVIATEELWVG